MRSSQEKSRFIEFLREMPTIYYAAKKIGISRATIYRWLKDNSDFKQRVNIALEQGRMGTNEIVEMSLISQAKKGNINASKFYLSHNHENYMSNPLPISPVAPIPGDHCKTCGHKNLSNMSDEELDSTIKDMESGQKSREEL